MRGLEVRSELATLSLVENVHLPAKEVHPGDGKAECLTLAEAEAGPRATVTR